MKEVISGDTLNKVILDAVNILGDATSSTLGPSGNNVILNKDDASPYITNDGVTIASSIESNDKKINTILELLKEAALKTNELVGDGTTTTTLLLQGIISFGLKEIENGKNKVILKHELNDALNFVTNKLLTLKKNPSKKDYEAIASISANDNEIGKFLANIFFKMKSRYAIKLDESPNDETYYEIKKGYTLEISDISNLYFQDTKKIDLSDAYILIIRGYIDNLERISEIINEGLERDKNIIILADDYSDLVNQELLLYHLEQNKNIYLFKIPDYGTKKEDIINDIVAISNAKVINIDYENVLWSNLGFIKNVIITKEEILLLNNFKNSKLLNELKRKLNSTYSDYEKELLESRIAKLDKGLATIYVGAPTKLELKEKMMRFEDALWALDIAKKGIVVGEGITYLKVSNDLSTPNAGSKIMKKVLELPFLKIMQIKKSNYQKIYNFTTGCYEDIDTTIIFDPVIVAIEVLKNATSIATMLLTTNYLVINENIKKEKFEL